MSIEIRWYKIDEDRKILWQINRGLYSYVSPYGEILYIGKVNGTTVRNRFQRSAKSRYWDFVGNHLGHFENEVVVGIFEFPEGSKHDAELLVESGRNKASKYSDRRVPIRADNHCTGSYDATMFSVDCDREIFVCPENRKSVIGINFEQMSAIPDQSSRLNSKSKTALIV